MRSPRSDHGKFALSANERRKNGWGQVVVFGFAVTVVLFGGCSRGGGDSEGVRISGTTRAPDSVTTSSPTTSSVGATAGGPQVSTLEAESPVRCQGETTSVAVRYTTADATTVSFLVDNVAVSGDPPLSGSFDITLDCDGDVHTVILVASGPSGQTLGSRALLTVRQS